MDEISVGFVTYFSVAMIMLPLFQVLHKKRNTWLWSFTCFLTGRRLPFYRTSVNVI